MLESKFEQRSSEIVQQGGQFFEKRTVNGISNLFPIDLTLSPTRDPVEALQRQKINEGITFAQQTALAGPGLKVAGGLGRGLLDFVGARAPRLGQQIKGLFVKPRPVNLPKKEIYPISNIPGVDFLPAMAVLPKRVGVKGLEPTTLTKGLTLGAGVGALNFLKADPTEMQEQVDALDAKKKNQQLEEQVQSNQDLKNADITTTEEDREKIRQGVADIDIQGAVLGDVTEEDIKETDLGDDSGQDGAATSDIKQTGITPFVDTQRFNDFIGAVGRSLVTTGQLGAGLAAGAVDAATLRQKRDLLAAEQQREEELLQRELDAKIAIEKLKGVTPELDANQVGQRSTQLAEEIKNFNANERARGLVEASIMILDDAIQSGEKLTGIGGIFNRVEDQFKALISKQEGFDSLSARTKVDKLSEIVKLQNARDILNDPRLSNFERQEIGNAFGELRTLEDPVVALSKLRNSRDTLAESNRTRQDLIATLHEGLILGGTSGAESYGRTKAEVDEILKINTDISTALATLNRLIGEGAFGSKLIPLEE
jgi:hypothetical protein